MQSAIFDTPFIKIDSLKTKFDTLVLSNSFIAVVGDHIEALFLHQLHYWSYSQYGVVIDDTRWIYKPLKEWLSEVFTFLSEWKLRKAIASLLEKGLIEREKLFVKHHELKHDNPYWHPKNQTYYYSVNYDKLQELIDKVENQFEKAKNPETPENVRIENLTELSVEDFSDTKCCELSQNKTDITSIKNYSKDQSHPTLPSVCDQRSWHAKRDRSTENNQDKRTISKPELTEVLQRPAKKKVDSVNFKAVEKDKSSERVEVKINQNIGTNKADVQESLREGKGEGEKGKENKNLSPNSDVQEPVQVEVEKPKLKKTPKGTKPQRKGQAPWKDEGQFKRFYRALIQALPIVANSHSPQGLAQTIIRQLRSGIPHSYWDDFVAGLPIGTSTMPEWEVEPGVPYPMFVEYLTEKIKAGDNKTSDEQTRNEVFRILSKPRQAKAFWGQFKRSIVNVSEQMMRDRALGVSNPNTPVWTRERIEPSLSEAAAAGQKIMTVINGNPQAVIESGQIPQLESEDIPSVPQSPNLPVPQSPNLPISQSPPDLWSDESQPKSSPKVNLQELLVKKLGDRASRFIKQMPKVSPEEAEAEAKAESEAKQRQQMNRKTHISQMSVAEINELLTDPITRKELMPQLWHSDYELITNEYGDIIGIRRSSSS